MLWLHNAWTCLMCMLCGSLDVLWLHSIHVCKHTPLCLFLWHIHRFEPHITHAIFLYACGKVESYWDMLWLCWTLVDVPWSIQVQVSASLLWGLICVLWYIDVEWRNLLTEPTPLDLWRKVLWRPSWAFSSNFLLRFSINFKVAFYTTFRIWKQWF